MLISADKYNDAGETCTVRAVAQQYRPSMRRPDAFQPNFQSGQSASIGGSHPHENDPTRWVENRLAICARCRLIERIEADNGLSSQRES